MPPFTSRVSVRAPARTGPLVAATIVSLVEACRTGRLHIVTAVDGPRLAFSQRRDPTDFSLYRCHDFGNPASLGGVLRERFEDAMRGGGVAMPRTNRVAFLDEIVERTPLGDCLQQRVILADLGPSDLFVRTYFRDIFPRRGDRRPYDMPRPGDPTTLGPWCRLRSDAAAMARGTCEVRAWGDCWPEGWPPQPADPDDGPEVFASARSHLVGCVVAYASLLAHPLTQVFPATSPDFEAMNRGRERAKLTPVPRPYVVDYLPALIRDGPPH